MNEEWVFVAPYLTLMDANAPQRKYPLRELFNGLRWVLGVVFDEDQSRGRVGSAQQNLAMLCRIALSLLKQDVTTTANIKMKRKRAVWDDAFLLHVLTQ